MQINQDLIRPHRNNLLERVNFSLSFVVLLQDKTRQLISSAYLDIPGVTSNAPFHVVREFCSVCSNLQLQENPAWI